MARRRPVALALTLASLVAGGLATAAVAQDESTPPLGPPVATPIADPPVVPSGDGAGVRFTTALGDIVIGLFTESSPVAAENFLNLASAGFYDGTVFHRIVPGFVIQGGDPTGTGSGDAGYSIVDEPVVGEYGRGIVAMARTQAPNSQGSQFFIVLDDEAQRALDSARTYAIIGRVVEGMEVADAIAAGPSTGPPEDRALEPVAIESTSIEQVVLPAEPSPAPPTAEEALAALVAVSVAGQQLQPQAISGAGLEAQFGPDDPVVTGLRAIAESAGRSLEDVALAVGGSDLPSGELLDITALRVAGADAAQLVVPFASLVTSNGGVTATPATLGGREVMVVAYAPAASVPPDGASQQVPITAYVSGDTVVLIRTADEPARDEILAALP
ncbi:MAG: peptidylprolyl isomerase [Candidatus Limnocylindrales bacterium]